MSDIAGTLTRRETLHVFNQDAAPLLVFLEPWAEFYLVPAGSTVEVIAFAPGDGQLEVDDNGNLLIIWGWMGSSVHVLRDGQELEPAILSAPEVAEISGRRMRPPVIQRQDHAPSMSQTRPG